MTEWLTNLAIVIGVWVAFSQLNAWRKEHFSKNVSETALKLYSKASTVQRAIANVRSVMEQLPPDVQNVMQATIQVKWERLKSYDEDFEELRELQVLHEALVGSEEVKKAVNALFDVRQEVYAAMATLNGWELDKNPREEHAKLYDDLRLKIYAAGGKYDSLAPRVTTAMDTLKASLFDEIRMKQH